MNPLVAYAVFYWVTYSVSAFGIGALIYDLSPKWAPIIVIPAVLAFFTKKWIENAVYRQKEQMLASTLANYQKRQVEKQFDNDDHSDVLN